jgi:hypothetical protein
VGITLRLWGREFFEMQEGVVPFWVDPKLSLPTILYAVVLTSSRPRSRGSYRDSRSRMASARGSGRAPSGGGCASAASGRRHRRPGRRDRRRSGGDLHRAE